MHIKAVLLSVLLFFVGGVVGLRPPLALTSPVLADCHGGFVGDPEAPPAIEILEAGPGRIAGRANNIDTGQMRVVLWALTNHWYVQPTVAQPHTFICRDGTWQNNTNRWFRMVALLVDPEIYNPAPGTRFDHPAFESGVLAWVQVPLPRAALPLEFSGYLWGVKVAECPFDPGPNRFSESEENVWKDEEGQLHLKIHLEENPPSCDPSRHRWTASEVYLLEPLGYGEYIFQLASRVDALDRRAVFSPFIYHHPPPVGEFDTEFSRGIGIPAPNNAQYVVQPWSVQGNRFFFVMPTEETSTHRVVWSAEALEFLSWKGLSTYPPDPNDVIAEWTYTNQLYIPVPGRARVRINLWLENGQPPMSGIGDEVIITSFTYQPPLQP